MFLIEELEIIHAKENLDIKSKIAQMLKAMVNRVPEPEEAVKMSLADYLTTLKLVDNRWRLFCKRHPNYDKDGWRDWVLKFDTDGKFKRALGW